MYHACDHLQPRPYYYDNVDSTLCAIHDMPLFESTLVMASLRLRFFLLLNLFLYLLFLGLVLDLIFRLLLARFFGIF